MSRVSPKQEDIEPTFEPKLFGLPRSWVGALSGILLYVVLVLSFFNAKQVELLWAIFLPGILVSEFLSNTFVSKVILFGLSSLPFALFGFLIFSQSEMKRTAGILALLMYFLLLMMVGYMP
jgi:hypothetical protein